MEAELAKNYFQKQAVLHFVKSVIVMSEKYRLVACILFFTENE